MGYIIWQESLKTIQLLLTQPVLYWSIFLIVVSSYERIERERLNFGYKIYDWQKEWQDMFLFSLISGLILSIIIVSVGFVFSYETIYLLNIVLIVFSMTCKYTLLSASYTIGTTYLLIILLPFLLPYQSFFSKTLFASNNFSGLIILLSLLLFVEVFLLRTIKRNDTYPSLTKSKRGAWIGQNQLRKISVLPLFFLVPHGLIEPIFPYWPLLNIGANSYHVMILPFILGFDHHLKGSLPHIVAKDLARSLSILAIIVLGLGVGSIYVPWLSLIAVIIAIGGREYIVFKLRAKDTENAPYFTSLNEGLRVLSIVPGSPAEKLGILVGEVITKVNGITVRTPDEFYIALQESGAFFRLDVIDDHDEVRFIQGAFYEDDDHKLGIIFPRERYHQQRMKISSKSS
ncbi:MAG TPA: PDZ domain-containing protein [Bacillota bacterium]|nr:PDZ domain-containing protein [Bacillota bacterium]